MKELPAYVFIGATLLALTTSRKKLYRKNPKLDIAEGQTVFSSLEEME